MRTWLADTWLKTDWQCVIHCTVGEFIQQDIGWWSTRCGTGSRGGGGYDRLTRRWNCATTPPPPPPPPTAQCSTSQDQLWPNNRNGETCKHCLRPVKYIHPFKCSMIVHHTTYMSDFAYDVTRATRAAGVIFFLIKWEECKIFHLGTWRRSEREPELSVQLFPTNNSKLVT